MADTTRQHIVSSYEDELVELTRLISEMGGMVEQLVADATKGLIRVDHEMARKAVADDKAIDDKQSHIDDFAVSMIARRQPMAGDLRKIVGSIHVATDLERIGDMAKNVGRRTLQISGVRLSQQLFAGVKHMSDLTLVQINKALDAVTSPSEELAIAVCEADDEVDALYMSLFREFLTYMMEDPRNITDCTHLLFCAKNLERAGDHATNIAEAAFYIKTGRNLPAELDARSAGPA